MREGKGPRRKSWNNVLVVTGGSTPQVVTETLYALATRAPEPFVPAKIICVVTKGVANGFGAPFEAALDRLKIEQNLTTDWDRRTQAWHAAATGLFVEYPRSPQEQPVDDIRTDEDAVYYGNLVSEIVQRETADPNARVFLSLAGGRKTMSFHGGAALSLFGRPQDELSHVLVHPSDYEGCSDFWFPTRGTSLVKHKDGRELNASESEVQIELAIIPYVRVRDRLPRSLIARRMDYARYVAQTNAVLGRVPLFLDLTTAERRVRIGDIFDFTLPNVEFALYQLMAEWKQNERPGAGPRGIGKSHFGWLTARMFEHPERYAPNPVERFIAIYNDTFKTGDSRATDIVYKITGAPQNATQRRLNGKAFGQWKAKLMDTLEEELSDSDLADRFGAPAQPVKVLSRGSDRLRKYVVFGVRLDAREIMINAG